MELTFTAKPRSAVCPLQSTPEPCRAARKVTFGQFKQPQLATKPLPPTTTDGYSQTPGGYTPGGDTHSGYIAGYIGGYIGGYK